MDIPRIQGYIIFSFIIVGILLMFIEPGLQFWRLVSPFNPTVDTVLKPQLQKNCAESLINLQVFNDSCKKLCKLEDSEDSKDSEYSPMSIVVLLIGLIVGGYLAFRFITDP